MPFSGISLLIHLLIIGSAKTLNFFGIRPSKLHRQASKKKAVAKVLLSNIIILTVTVLIGLSLFTAIKTSYIEGAREPQRKFINNGYLKTKDWALRAAERLVIAQGAIGHSASDFVVGIFLDGSGTR